MTMYLIELFKRLFRKKTQDWRIEFLRQARKRNPKITQWQLLKLLSDAVYADEPSLTGIGIYGLDDRSDETLI
jgi:hypothetical protein